MLERSKNMRPRQPSEEDRRTMARYRFHATNGYECVFDAEGKEIRLPDRSPERLVRRAGEVARDVMRRLDGREDWSAWHVSVHDLTGRRVLVRPFV
jgi:hypothetical protein